jgi:Penicillin-insensitive murein endopeptidase
VPPFRPLALLLPALIAAVAAGALAVAADERDGRRTTGGADTVPELDPEPLPVTPPEAEGEKLPEPNSEPAPERIRWRRSVALGSATDGRLIRGVRLPHEGEHHFTWDPVKRRSPNRGWRRWGTARLVRLLLDVARAYGAAHPDAPRMAIGDLSRPRGGDFGPQFGYIGHASHQNGLDADVYYPRADGREKAPKYASQIDRTLSQELVDRFTGKGVEVVFVGPGTGLVGPAGVVQVLANHDNHMHVRIR